jgi:hypothetical protein
MVGVGMNIALYGHCISVQSWMHKHSHKAAQISMNSLRLRVAVAAKKAAAIIKFCYQAFFLRFFKRTFFVCALDSITVVRE